MLVLMDDRTTAIPSVLGLICPLQQPVVTAAADLIAAAQLNSRLGKSLDWDTPAGRLNELPESLMNNCVLR